MNKLKTVLLVDDYDADNFIHRLVLERYGCADHIEVRRDGKQALEYIQSRIDVGESLPELIFLDINMPVMNGWEFLSAFESLSEGKEGGAIVIMLTTSLNPDDKATAEQHPDVRGFVYKPLSEARLTEVLSEYFPDSAKSP